MQGQQHFQKRGQQGHYQQQGNSFNQTPQRQPMKINMAENLLAEFGRKYNFAVYESGVDTNEVLEVIKRTCFPSKKEATNEQLVVFLTVAKQYNLNPFTKEIYAYPDKSGGIVPIVGVIGWANIINHHEQLEGMSFKYSNEMVDLLNENGQPNGKTAHVWIECELTRKDRKIPTVIREYFSEVYKATDPWANYPIRMHRHKSLIQCARYAFGLSGIYDQEDGELMSADYIQGEYIESTNQNQPVENTIETVVHVANQSEQHTHQEQQVQDYHPAEQPPAEQQQAQENMVQKPYMTEAIFKKMLLKVKTLVVDGTMSMTQFIAQAETMYSLTPEQIEQFNVEAKQ